MNNFSKLGLSEQTLKALNQINITVPTEIQQNSIPLLLEENCNFLGLAQTGTGKTAAYSLPLIERVDPDKREIQALIITPTRELGHQVAEQIIAFSKYKKNLRVDVVYGGKPIDKQIAYLRKKPAILVATPGRLLDLLRRKALNLKHIVNVVLDEADEMLNMGFEEDINTILSLTPPYKKIWLFSATMPVEIQKIAENYMPDYEEVRVKREEKVNSDIRHEYIRVKAAQKFEALLKILKQDENMNAVIFCRTRMDTQRLAEDLIDEGYSADAIHGDLSQHQRDRVMNRFKTHRMRFLIATDVAARGIDVKDLTHVIHYALPEQMEYYTHRSGRTARAGNEGVSIAIVTGAEYSRMKLFSQNLQIFFEESLLQSEFDFDPYENNGKEKRGRGRRKSGERNRESRGFGKRDRNTRRTEGKSRREPRSKQSSETSENQNKSTNFFEERRKPKKTSSKRTERKESPKASYKSENKDKKRKHIKKSKSSFAGSSYDMPPREKSKKEDNKYRRKVDL